MYAKISQVDAHAGVSPRPALGAGTGASGGSFSGPFCPHPDKESDSNNPTRMQATQRMIHSIKKSKGWYHGHERTTSA